MIEVKRNNAFITLIEMVKESTFVVCVEIFPKHNEVGSHEENIKLINSKG